MLLGSAFTAQIAGGSTDGNVFRSIASCYALIDPLRRRPLEGIISIPQGICHYAGSHFRLFPNHYFKWPLQRGALDRTRVHRGRLPRFFVDDRADPVERGIDEIEGGFSSKFIHPRAGDDGRRPRSDVHRLQRSKLLYGHALAASPKDVQERYVLHQWTMRSVPIGPARDPLSPLINRCPTSDPNGNRFRQLTVPPAVPFVIQAGSAASTRHCSGLVLGGVLPRRTVPLAGARAPQVTEGIGLRQFGVQSYDGFAVRSDVHDPLPEPGVVVAARRNSAGRASPVSAGAPGGRR